MRNDKIQRRKIIAYISYRLWLFFVSVQRQIINAIIGKMKQGQWIMGLVLPLSREMNLSVMKRMWIRLTKSEDDTRIIFNLTATVMINLQLAVWVAIVVTATASRLTICCILTSDIFINLYEIYTIKSLFGEKNVDRIG